MKILLVNNIIGYAGGAETIVLNTGKLLESKGHEVYYFGTDQNTCLTSKEHLVNFTHFSAMPLYKRPFYILKSIYNQEAKQKFMQYLDLIKPDLVHFNVIEYQLTISVLDCCRIAGIPAIMTMHNPYLLCPSVRLLIKNEHYCYNELCIPGNPTHCIIHRCAGKSLAKSLVSTIEYTYRKIFRNLDVIRYFIVPSEELKRLAITSGISESRIVVIRNFVDESYFKAIPEANNNNYFIYAGRLSPEKGVDLLIKAMRYVSPEIHLKIIGTGNELEKLKSMTRDYNLSNITFTGFMPPESLQEEYKNCLACILPTVGFENAPLNVLEAFSYGKPVIGSKLGGIPELIEEGVTGYLFEPGNALELSEKITTTYASPETALHMGHNGRHRLDQFHSPDFYYSQLLNTYQKIVEETNKL
jgi:glycosyltransferase involved in cell wall biosynthesis